MKSRTEVAWTRLTLLVLVLTATFIANAQTYSYPSSYACGDTIRARVLSANASSIVFEVQKRGVTCSDTVPFNPPPQVNSGEAQVRADTINGAILGRATYYRYDPRVLVTIPSFTSGTRAFFASIDAFRAGPISISVTSTAPRPADMIASWQGALPAEKPAGTTITLQGQAMNVGGSTSAPSQATFVYTTSSTLTASNGIRIGSSMYVPSLAPNASSPVLSTSWTIPSGLAGTTVRIGLLVDSGNAVAESSETNNLYGGAMAMRVTPLAVIQIGPVAWIHQKVSTDVYRTMTEAEMNALVASVISEIGGGVTTLEGNGRRAVLQMSVEMPWSTTQPVRGQQPDFSPFVKLARICAAKKIRLALQFSPHDLPGWVRDDYRYDVINNGFLPLKPTSSAWTAQGPAASWIRAGIIALATDNGTNHFGAGGAIDTIIVGNEVQYTTRAATATEAATRAVTLARMLAGLMTVARQQLDAYGMQRIAVTTKLYPYYFPPHDALDSSYSTESLKILHDNMRGLAAFDSYAKAARYTGTTCKSYDWLVTQDIDAAKRYAQGLPLYMAEFDHDRGACPTGMSAQAIADAVSYGISRGATAFSFFAWNPRDTNRQMGPEQKAGLKRAFYATVGR